MANISWSRLALSIRKIGPQTKEEPRPQYTLTILWSSFRRNRELVLVVQLYSNHMTRVLIYFQRQLALVLNCLFLSFKMHTETQTSCCLIHYQTFLSHNSLPPLSPFVTGCQHGSRVLSQQHPSSSFQHESFLGTIPVLFIFVPPSTVSTCSGHGTRWMFFRESINFYQLIPPYFFPCCLHNCNEIQILVGDSWFIACLVKVVSLRQSTSWWRNPMNLSSGVLAKEADPQHSFPKLGFSRLTRGEGRPLQMDICSSCYSGSRHTLNTSICPQINCVRLCFWTTDR